MAEEEKKGRRPDISLVQPGVDQDGKKQLRSVGGMWETKTKEGKKMWTVSIGGLRLMGFPNDGEPRKKE